MLHETIFNATLEPRVLLDKYGGQRVKKTAAENHSGSVVSGNPDKSRRKTGGHLTISSDWRNILISRKFSVLRGAVWDDVALKISGGGVTRTNTNKIRATMLQVFESLSKTCNMLPQQNVALKIALCTLLHEAPFNATMLR